MQFFKYHGAGNDFVVVDNRKQAYNFNNPELIRKLTHRRFGVGADGVISLENDENTDFRMLYYNADGYEGSMCGNGGRCIVAFAKYLGIIDKKTTFNACDGLHHAEIDDTGIVNLKMIDVGNIEKRSPTDFVLDTGSPHYVRFVKDLGELDIEKEGKIIRHSDEFDKEGINVNFVQIKDNNNLDLETFERGVEAITYACGTGAVATAICFSILNNKIDAQKINLQTQGGLLSVSFSKKENRFENVWLSGPAKLVFEGTF